ncbi:MAG: hypothetical protein A4E28_01978 [Methanocella sp. PtaU1.Bin125]|nr:MAG: hypothetical protein A4E28_01978 [Methanocella sp. PtaU1.Bin125]
MTVLVVVSLAALIIPVALSQGPGPGMKGRRGGPALDVDTIYNVIGVTGATDTSVSFDILGSAIKGKDGRVIFMNETLTRSGTYYFANDTAVIPFLNRTPGERPRPVIGNYDNASVNVAGASAVVTMKNLTMTRYGRGEHEAQFTGLGVYLPDGTAKSYTLTTPARITRSPDNRSMMIAGSPSMRTALQDMVKSGARFPADAKPVMLKEIDAVK